jgi:hypothetical protein
MLVFNNYFCKNRKSKLHFGDRVAVINVFFTKPEGVVSSLSFRSRKQLINSLQLSLVVEEMCEDCGGGMGA